MVERGFIHCLGYISGILAVLRGYSIKVLIEDAQKFVRFTSVVILDDLDVGLPLSRCAGDELVREGIVYL